MFLNLMFMLNYSLGLTLIQSSLKALKGGVIEGFSTQAYILCRHSHMNVYCHSTTAGWSVRVATALKPVSLKVAQPPSSKTDFLHTVVLVSDERSDLLATSKGILLWPDKSKTPFHELTLFPTCLHFFKRPHLLI